MLKIGEFSRLAKLPVKTLRFYDDIGLFSPCGVNPENGYRLYSTEQLAVLARIIELREIGFALDEIKELLRRELSDAEMIRVLQEKEKQAGETIAAQKERLRKIKTQIKLLEVRTMEKAFVKALPECIVYSKRMTIPSYDTYFEVIPAIGEEVKAANPTLTCAEPAYCFIIYHDGEYKEKDIDVEYCEAVTAWGKDTDTIKFKKIEQVDTAACIYHRGPYRTLGGSYGALFGWIGQAGYGVIGLPRESYIDGIWNKEDESQWLTEIQIPVKKK